MFSIRIEFNEETSMNTISLLGEFNEEYDKSFKEFIEFYDLNNLIFYPTTKNKLKRKEERKCRFCEKTMPEVTFKKEAHLIPQLMGNKNLLSEYECDSCNSFFSKYESELANFMGLTRTLSFLKGQSGLPKFKTPDKNLIVGESEDPSVPKKIEIVSMGLDNENCKIDKENKLLIFKSVKQPYTPIKVYKLLLKIGYSLLPPEELSDYEIIKKVLMSDDLDGKLVNHPLFRLIGFFSPGVPFSSPLIFCYKKRNEKKDMNYPTRVFIIYFQNFIYQFFLPFYEGDKWMVKKGGNVTLKFMPPLLDKSWIEYFGEPGRFNLDLSSNEVKKNEAQNITMKFDSAVIETDIDKLNKQDLE